jgi:hypothetical protein
MATQAQLDRIHSAATDIQAVPIDQVVANPAKWGPISFEPARRDLELIVSMATHLSTLPIDILPDNVAEAIATALEVCRDNIKKLLAFDLKQPGNINQLQQQIISETTAYAQQLLVAAQGWIPFLAYQRGDVQRNITELTQAVQRAGQVLTEAQASASHTREEIDQIVAAAREASASAGVGVFTSDFAGEAKTLQEDANRWLWGTLTFAALTLLFALATAFVPIQRDVGNAQLIQYMSSKFVILVTLLTATVWCGRLFKAVKHQVATNNHRANALKTFQAFIKASSDDATRDAVLLETTRSIFAIAPSGYLDTSESTPDAGTKIMEIFKGVRGAG